MTRGSRYLSGIQPTGVLHLGNYLGAVRQWVSAQDDSECFIMIADAHAITVPHDPRELRESTLRTAAWLLACGLDPERVTLFAQSDVPAHLQLAWLLASVTRMGELRRMTQFKDKSEQHGSSLALFTYPVLQAADILLYDTTAVPVGEDQRQHVELTRDIAHRFNTTFGETFALPHIAVVESGARVMDLQDPTVKMSKSSPGGAGAIWLLDDHVQIVTKIGRAVTDGGDEVRCGADKPGVSNLLQIYASIMSMSVREAELHFSGCRYGELKRQTAEAVDHLITPIRSGYHELVRDSDRLLDVLDTGAEKARATSAPTLERAMEAVGLTSQPKLSRIDR